MRGNFGSSEGSFFGSISLNIWLIIINVVAFVAFTILISLNVLGINSVAIMPSNILQGKYLWTFITSMFMHGGFFHLFVNMLSLLFIGSLTERLIGKKRYFWFYILSGIFAGLFFVLSAWVLNSFGYSGDYNIYAVGASGALFGLIGVLVLLTPNLPVYVMFIPIPIKLKYAAPGILILLWIISIAGNVPIGNTAHLGGLIAGLAYGVYLRKKFRKKTSYMRKYFV